MAESAVFFGNLSFQGIAVGLGEGGFEAVEVTPIFWGIGAPSGVGCYENVVHGGQEAEVFWARATSMSMPVSVAL